MPRPSTASGDQVEGKHPAAWPFELWQRMIEVKASQYRRPTKEAQKRPHEFSRIIVCAACHRPLRVTKSDQIHYYSDTSLVRKLECAASGSLTVRSGIVIQQFGEMLRSIILPDFWRQAIAERCMAETREDEDIERVRLRRAELAAEQKRLVTVFTKGFISEEQLDVAMERIRAELFTLPMPITRSAEELTRTALSAGETLENMADYWNEATAEERRDGLVLAQRRGADFRPGAARDRGYTSQGELSPRFEPGSGGNRALGAAQRRTMVARGVLAREAREKRSPCTSAAGTESHPRPAGGCRGALAAGMVDTRGRATPWSVEGLDPSSRQKRGRAAPEQWAKTDAGAAGRGYGNASFGGIAAQGGRALRDQS